MRIAPVIHVVREAADHPLHRGNAAKGQHETSEHMHWLAGAVAINPIALRQSLSLTKASKML